MKNFNRPSLYLAPRLLAAYVLLLVLQFALQSCTPPPAPEPPRSWEVRVGTVQSIERQSTIESFGSISWRTKVELLASQEGTLDRLLVREGDRVQANQVVAVLKNDQLAIALDRAGNGVRAAQSAVEIARVRLVEGRFSAESRLQSLEKSKLELEQSRRELAEMERKHNDQVTLHAAGGLADEALRASQFSLDGAKERIALMSMDISIREIGLRPQDLATAGMRVPSQPQALTQALIELSVLSLKAEEEAARARLEASEQELAQTRLALGELTIRSPRQGVVGARHKELGERVKRDDPLLTIIDARDLVAMIPVRERDAIVLATGMKAELGIDALSWQGQGTIDLVSPLADPTTGSFSVRISIPQTLSNARPGMFVRASIALPGAKEVLAIPQSAIIDQGRDEGRVFVVRNGRLNLVRVSLGESFDDSRVVNSGLAADALVVLEPQQSMREGDTAVAL